MARLWLFSTTARLVAQEGVQGVTCVSGYPAVSRSDDGHADLCENLGCEHVTVKMP